LENQISYKSSWVTIFSIAIIYFIFGKISFSIEQHYNVVTIVIFAAEGFALAAAIIYRVNILPGIFLGQFFLGIENMTTLPSLGIATINTIEAFIAITLFHKFNLDRALSKTKDIFGLIVLIVFVLQPFSATLGSLTLLIFNIITADEYFNSLFSWWFGNAMGQILFTPMLLLIYSHFKKEELLEFLFVALFFGLLSYLFQIVVPIQNLSLLLSVTLPFIIYLSSIRGLHYATFATTIITATTLFFMYLGKGVFVEDTTVNNIINLNFYFLSQILLVLIIGTLFSEKKKRAKELESLINQAVEKNRKQEIMLSHQSRLTQMGEAINMIAHQWRQPLNNLNGLVLLMDLKLSKQKNIDKNLLEKEFNEIETTTTYMSHTIDDFRDFFKPQKEKIKFNLKDTIESTMRLIQPVMLHEEIKIKHLYEKNIHLIGYPNEIGQVIINIINNAKDALISNNLNREKNIYISLFKKEHKVVITIQDNAGGVDKNIINHIFDPYFSTKLKKNGTGLGLYISKMIIEEHMEGKLSVENSKDGALFKIEFGECKNTYDILN
jgi:signal transduction histidine kinase